MRIAFGIKACFIICVSYLLLSCSVAEEGTELVIKDRSPGSRIGVLRGVSLGFPSPVSRIRHIRRVSPHGSKRERQLFFISFETDEKCPVFSVAEGTVLFLENITYRHKEYYLVVEHANSLLTIYRGVLRPVVKEGEKVKAGEKIASCDDFFAFAIAENSNAVADDAVESFYSQLYKENRLRFLRVDLLLTGKGQ